MEFGLSLPIVQQVPGRAQTWEAEAGPGELLRVAQAADRLGYAWVTCSDHVAVPASYRAAMGPTWYEPATTLAFIAAATHRVRLLSHVLVLPYRHPLLIAKTFATLDRLSAGRVVIGAGSGHLKPEFRSLGIDHASRGARSDEYLQAVAVALEQEVSSFEGASVRWRDMMVSPRPVQLPRPPIWVGGNTRAVAERAARYGDGWIPWQLEPDEFAARVDDARAVRRAAGHAAPFALIAPVSIARDTGPTAVIERVRAWRRAGATACHLGFDNDGLDDLLDRLERFQRDVPPAVE